MSNNAALEKHNKMSVPVYVMFTAVFASGIMFFNYNCFWYFELMCVLVAIIMLIDWGCESYNILRTLCAKKDLSKYGPGSWALVTGATDGIGLAFATLLAKSGFNIILISRTQTKLDKVASDLKSNSVEILTIVADFSKCPENPSEFFNRIDQKTRDLDVSIVVNNVGTAVIGYFEELTDQRLADQNALNLWPVVYLTKIFISRMMKRSKPSAVLNVSSVSAFNAYPGLATYSATKSFGHLFTLDVNEEVKFLVKEGKMKEIDIFSFTPGIVDTPLSAKVTTRPLMVTPIQCAERALSVLGKSEFSIGHWRNILYSVILRNLPKWVNVRIRLAFMKKEFKNK